LSEPLNLEIEGAIMKQSRASRKKRSKSIKDDKVDEVVKKPKGNTMERMALEHSIDYESMKEIAMAKKKAETKEK